MFDLYFNNVNNFFRNKMHEHVGTCYLCDSKNVSTKYIMLSQCDDCGFTWLTNRPTQVVLNEFYEQSDAMKTWSKIKSGGLDDERQNAKYDMFWRHIIKESLSSVIDVGCGTGYFLHGCPGGLSLVGVEPNQDSARHCNVPIMMPGELKGQFDLITLFGVLEHVSEPRKVLKNYINNLSDDGYVGIIVPNIDSLAFSVLGHRNCSICPQHLWYFSISSLVSLFKQFDLSLHSFKTVETEYQPICKALFNIDPYVRLGSLELEHPVIKEKDILKNNLGAKICAIFTREGNDASQTHSNNSSKEEFQIH